jgi:membrane protease YdiL (CAAX protease family)
MTWWAFGVSLLLVGVVAVVTGHPTSEALEVTWAHAGWGCVWGAGLFLVVQGVAQFVPDQVAAGAENEQAEDQLGYNLPSKIGIGISAGVIEEYVFRGVAQSALTPLIGIPAAIALTNAAFGACHSRTNFALFLATALMGAALGIIFALTVSLMQAMVAHAVVNVIMTVAGEYLETARDRVATEQSNEQV